jgi:hypothetical protein
MRNCFQHRKPQLAWKGSPYDSMIPIGCTVGTILHLQNLPITTTILVFNFVTTLIATTEMPLLIIDKLKIGNSYCYGNYHSLGKWAYTWTSWAQLISLAQLDPLSYYGLTESYNTLKTTFGARGIRYMIQISYEE